MPYTAAQPLIRYSTFSWERTLAANEIAPQTFLNSTELEDFIATYGNGETLDVDFSKEAVIAVFGISAASAEYLAPIVTIGDTITVTARNETSVIANAALNGYFLILDRERLTDDMEITYTDRDSIEEDITPETLRNATELQIIKDTKTLETYLLRPGYAAVKLGLGFGGAGVLSVEVSDDLSYLVYTYSFGSGLYRSHVDVELLDGSGKRYRSSMLKGADMLIEPLGENKWAVYQAEVTFLVHQPIPEPDPVPFQTEKGKLLAILTVKPEGVLVEIMHEDGMALLDKEPPEPPEPTPPEPTPTEPEETVTVGNTPGNSYVAEYGGRVYYFTIDALYSMNIDGSDKVKVVGHGGFNLNIIHDRIYYSTGNDNDGWALFSMNLDGSDRKILFDYAANPFTSVLNFVVTDHRIYFRGNMEGDFLGRIFSMDLDGGDIQQLTGAGASQFFFANSRIYYFYRNMETEDHTFHICSMELDGTDKKIICDGFNFRAVIGDRIYISGISESGDSSFFYSIALDGSDKKHISNDFVADIHAVDDRLYFSKNHSNDNAWNSDGNIYSINKDGTNRQKLSDYSERYINALNMAGGRLYYYVFTHIGNEPALFYSMNLDGTDKRRMDWMD
jgi:hypothetical protein